MADAVATQILHESATRITAAFSNISDGTGEADVIKFDVSALSGGACAALDIEKIWYATDGMAVRVEYDGATDSVAFLVPANQNGHMDFTESFRGGLKDPRLSTPTGDILFTTIGHTAGDTYWIMIQARKRLTAEL